MDAIYNFVYNSVNRNKRTNNKKNDVYRYRINNENNDVYDDHINNENTN